MNRSRFTRRAGRALRLIALAALTGASVNAFAGLSASAPERSTGTNRAGTAQPHGVSGMPDETVSPVAVAADVATDVVFHKLDTNSNNLIDRYEAKASKDLDQHFGQIDTNHDYQISPSEYFAYETRKAESEESGGARG